MKYLIIECNELNDQYECDADRNPVCVTDDYSKYDKWGYEVYEILSDGNLLKIKDYDYLTDEHFAVYGWSNSNSPEYTEPDVIFEKFENKTRQDITKSFIKKLKTKYHFSETVEEIYRDVQMSGSHGEEIGDKWIVLGEFCGCGYSVGY